MSRYIAAIDQGTTSTHCMLSDRRGEVAAARQLEYQQILPQQVWVEHDPIELWHRTQDMAACVRSVHIAQGKKAVERSLVWVDR